MQVKQSGWNAEYRAALGGVVNAVTKSGSNTFHGSAGTYYTDNDWLGDIRRTLRSVPTDASKAEYVTIPRDESHQTDVVLHARRTDPEGQGLVLRRLRAAVLPVRAHGHVGDPRHLPGDADVRQRRPNNKAVNYNVTSQLTNSLRARFTGNNETQKGALGLPAIEPNGTSTASAATFNPRSPVFTEQFSNAYSGIVDWVATPKTYVNVTVSYLGYGLHSAGGDYYHGTRRTFSTPNVGLADVPAESPERQRFRRQQLELVHGGGRLPALQPLDGRDQVRALEG